MKVDMRLSEILKQKNIGHKTDSQFNVAHQKKALIIASVASMLDNFNRSNIDILLELGYDVTLAANFCTEEDINSQTKIDVFSNEMKAKGVRIVHIDFSRKIWNVNQQTKSIRQVRKLLENSFDLIHCHSPICATIVRAVAQRYRKQYGTKVIYTAHGFHFFKGARMRNWMIFYPIEKWMSHYTDILITINKEDYWRAKKYFSAKKTVYIPGVGINTEKFKIKDVDLERRRESFGLTSDDIMLLSVGELSDRKNQKIIIEALGQIKNTRLHYFIAGIGKLEDEYKRQARKFGIEENIHLLGYRTDISELCNIADVFVFPSKQEGLPMALMEAIACRTPVLCSNIRGNTDLVKNKDYLFRPDNKDEIVKCFMRFDTRVQVRTMFQGVVEENYKNLIKRDLNTINKYMDAIYRC